MMREQAIECRRHAEECRQAAETARDKATRNSFKRAHDTWSLLAEEIEKAMESAETAGQNSAEREV